jgi:hypothetical protein
MPGPMMLGSGQGGPPSPGATPGMQGNPLADQAISALGAVNPRSPNTTQALQKIEEALDLAHKLVMAILPQLSVTNPKIAKDAHNAARMLLSVRSDMRKETAPEPPPDLMLGMGSAGAPAPPMGAPPAGGGPSGM